MNLVCRLEQEVVRARLPTRQSRNQKESIPTRKGIRPKTIRGPFHIQCGGSGDAGHFRQLIAEVLSWPNVGCVPSLADSPDLISIHLKQGQGPIGSLGVIAVRRFAQVYLQAPTIVLTLPLVTAHWAIVRGRAEPHYLASHGLMPAGTVLLHVPTDESEREVCCFHFSRACELARKSLKTKDSTTLTAVQIFPFLNSGKGREDNEE